MGWYRSAPQKSTKEKVANGEVLRHTFDQKVRGDPQNTVPSSVKEELAGI